MNEVRISEVSISRSGRGFTLVEVLVAMAITVVVATIAYTFFDKAIDAAEQSDQVLQEINEIETVWQLLSTDLSHLIDRDLPAAVAGPSGRGATPAFLGGDAARDSTQTYDGEYMLRFVRDGWANPLQQQRSDLQRVGYRWIDGQLWRDYWSELNQPLDTEPLGRRFVLTEIEAIQVRFLPRGARSITSNDWVESWPEGNGGARVPLPLAIEITLTVEGVGDVQRIFSLSRS